MKGMELIDATRNGRMSVAVRRMGTVLIMAGIAISAVLCLWVTPIVIERPIVLLLAALVCGLNLERFSGVTLLQRIVLAYLIAIAFNELSLHSVPISLGGIHLTAPSCFLGLVLLVIGFLLRATVNTSSRVASDDRAVLLSWGLCLAIIVSHMLLLAWLLGRFNDYGGEHNLRTIGSLCLHFLVFFLCWSQLAVVRFRQITALLFGAIFLGMLVR